MFIRATIKNRNGETFTVKVENKCDILIPRNKVEAIIFYPKVAALLGKFYWKIRKYANSEHAIQTLVTDVPFIINQLEKDGIKAEFLLEESELVEA